MATKSLPGPEFEEGIFTVEGENISNLMQDVDSQISSIMSEFGTDKEGVDFFLSVFRVVKDQGELAWLFRCTPAELPIMERLRDEYGGGKFEVRVYKNKKIYKRININVEAPKKEIAPVQIKNDLAELVKALADQQQANFTMLKDSLMQIVGKPQVQPSQLETMTVMLGMMKTFKDVMVPANPAPAVDVERIFDVFAKGMEIGRESGGGGDSEGIMGLAKEFLKSPLIGVMAQQATNPPSIPRIPNQRPAVQLPKNPAENVTHPQPSQPSQPMQPDQSTNSEGDNVNKIFIAQIKPHLDNLVKKAERDSDPILYAEFILDNVPQSMVEQFILQDNLIEELSKINPKVSEHKDWFMELRNHIHGVLTGEGEEAETGEHATGSPVNPSNDPVGNSGDASDS